ncbi:unnamed protein product, partial [Darwinula stevensoni]
LAAIALSISLFHLVGSTSPAMDASKMKEANIVPDMITTVPPNVVEVKYADSKKEVRMGEVLTPSDVRNVPEVTFKADPSSLYTLVMADPDAPTPRDPKFRELLHWMVINIPGNNVTSGDTVVEYIGSGPPQNSEAHRYVFLVFKQLGTIEPGWVKHIDNKTRDGRQNFEVTRFARQFRLGDPIAGNFFRA